MDGVGRVYVDGQEITSYSDNNGEFEFGDIEYPYQVPSNQLFVLSDNLNDLQDSRSSYIGCIKKEDIIGKVLFKLWG